MPKFCANLSLLFADVPLAERFGRAAAAGFRAVEVQFPYELPAAQTAALLQAHQLELVLHNLPAGDWAAGDRGIAVQTARQAEFREGVARGIAYARAVGCRRLNCLAGIPAAGEERKRCFEILVGNLAFAAEALAGAGLSLLMEPVNTKDVPGFFLSSTLEALRVMEAVDHPNLQLQFDLYHMQRMEGDLIQTINALAAPGEGPRIGHMQIADNPGRHEPGTGEINFANVFSAIDATGYEGWIGCEYVPRGRTEDGLGWLQACL